MRRAALVVIVVLLTLGASGASAKPGEGSTQIKLHLVPPNSGKYGIYLDEYAFWGEMLAYSNPHCFERRRFTLFKNGVEFASTASKGPAGSFVFKLGPSATGTYVAKSPEKILPAGQSQLPPGMRKPVVCTATVSNVVSVP